MSRDIDYYGLLGVGKDASEAEIRERFRAIARESHPDRAPRDRKAEAESKFQVLTEALNVLTNPEKRRAYDFDRAAAASAPPNEDAIAQNYVNQGIAAFKERKYTEAAGNFQLAAHRDPKDVKAQHYLGLASVPRGRHARGGQGDRDRDRARAAQRHAAPRRGRDLPPGGTPDEGGEGVPGSAALGSVRRGCAQGARRDPNAAGGSELMEKMAAIDAFGLTDVGKKRKHNEDAYALEETEGLFIVADGMGGHAAGEVAAKITVETIGEFIAATRQKEEATWPFKYNHELQFNSNRLAIAIEKANERVMSAVAAQPWLKGMGTTVVAGLLNEKVLSLAHVGDSRAYLYRKGDLTRLTDDHSWVHEQVAAGILTEEEAKTHPLKNVVTRALGGGPSVVAGHPRDGVRPGRRFSLLFRRAHHDALRRGDPRHGGRRGEEGRAGALPGAHRPRQRQGRRRQHHRRVRPRRASREKQVDRRATARVESVPRCRLKPLAFPNMSRGRGFRPEARRRGAGSRRTN